MGTLSVRTGAARRAACRRGRGSTPTRTCRPASSRTCARGCSGTCCSCSRRTTCAARRTSKHYQLAQQLRRTLVTIDRDYLDDRRFPPDEGGGVLVIHAPDERQLSLAARAHRPHRCFIPTTRRPGRAAARRPQAAGATPTGAAECMTPDARARTARRARSPSPSTTPARVAGRARTVDAGRRSRRPPRIDGARRRAWRGVGGAAVARRRRGQSRNRRRSPPVVAALAQRFAGPFAQDGASPSGTAAAVGRSVGRRGARRAGRGVLRRRRAHDRRHRSRRRAGDRRARPRGVGRLAGAQPGRARGLPEDRLPRGRSRRGRHRAAADLAHQGRRSLARAGRGQAAISPRSPSSTCSTRRAHGDGVSISVVRDTAKYLGMAAANLVVIADPEMLVLGGIMASAADLLLEPVRAEIARRLPQADDGRAGDRDRRRSAPTPRRSAPRASRPRRCHDRPVGRRAGAARPHPLARHARHRRRTHRRDPFRRAVGRPRRSPSRFTATTSFPASSTCTCTASTASTRSTIGRRRCRRGDRGAAAALRRHRVLSDDGRVRAGGAARACSIRCARARETPRRASARVLPAHLESNFINPEYSGAQPLGLPAQPAGGAWRRRRSGGQAGAATAAIEFTAADILAEIERAAPDVGIVTLAPELDGGLDLVRWLGVARPSRVARSLRRDLRRSARGDRRRRAARDASVQPDAAARPSRARAGRRGAADRRGRRGDHLRRRARAPRARPHGDRRQAAVAHHGDHRRAPPPPACRSGRAPRSAASRSPPASRRRCWPTARSPAAC